MISFHPCALFWRSPFPSNEEAHHPSTINLSHQRIFIYLKEHSKMAKTYKRISNVDEPSNTTSTTSTATSSDHQKTIQEQIFDKLHAIFFISLSYATIKYTDTITIVLTSSDVLRPLLYVSIILITVNTILLSYLSIYIPKIKGIKIDNDNNSSIKTNGDLWQVYCPRVIPIMTLNGVLCGIFLIRCFWPVWGFLTPFILGTEFFGLLFVTHFIPWI